MRRWTFLGVSLVLCLSISAQADIIYQGSLSSSDGGLFAVGIAPSVATLEWEVSRDPSGDASAVELEDYDPWHYKYKVTFDPEIANAISHIAIEVSDNFGIDDLTNLVLNPAGFYDATYNPEPGTEPSQDWVPGNLFAIKFDAIAEEDGGTEVTSSLTIEFDSWRVPEWGDFNVKGGQWYLYNEGFVVCDDNDPEFLPGSQLDLLDPTTTNGDTVYTGSYFNHVVVPDTVYVPVPAGVLLGMLGLSVVGIKLRKHA